MACKFWQSQSSVWSIQDGRGAFNLPKTNCAVQIVDLMAAEKGWWRWKAGREQRRAEDYLSTFTSNPSAPGTKDKSQEKMDLISSPERGGGA